MEAGVVMTAPHLAPEAAALLAATECVVAALTGQPVPPERIA